MPRRPRSISPRRSDPVRGPGFAICRPVEQQYGPALSNADGRVFPHSARDFMCRFYRGAASRTWTEQRFLHKHTYHLVNCMRYRRHSRVIVAAVTEHHRHRSASRDARYNREMIARSLFSSRKRVPPPSVPRFLVPPVAAPCG